MRARELRDLTDDELDRKMAETRQELFNLRFQSATGALENSARLRMAKREIARILTVKNERDDWEEPDGREEEETGRSPGRRCVADEPAVEEAAEAAVEEPVAEPVARSSPRRC